MPCYRELRPSLPEELSGWRADFFNEISDAAIDLHVEYGAQLPTGLSAVHLHPIDGAASRIPGRDSLRLPRRRLGRCHHGR
jgi:hypothetical protein